MFSSKNEGKLCSAWIWRECGQKGLELAYENGKQDSNVKLVDQCVKELQIETRSDDNISKGIDVGGKDVDMKVAKQPTHKEDNTLPKMMKGGRE